MGLYGADPAIEGGPRTDVEHGPIYLFRALYANLGRINAFFQAQSRRVGRYIGRGVAQGAAYLLTLNYLASK